MSLCALHNGGGVGIGKAVNESHEVAQGYKEVKVLTLTAKFKRKDADEYFLAWTTTPWTLAANVALTVGPDVDYVNTSVVTMTRLDDPEDVRVNNSYIFRR